ncbi:uncharacterized protein DEA37_0006221 [Paragonimus westermani]|uniref:MORN repeat-containing protein 3 n=1 Tax=Paragonimus westermani TaxID=34504 RepID=A0A5J4NKQ8_9TREM|nr:uncharacterized protein DEA37_0006221 [Paragonimus westermani]
MPLSTLKRNSGWEIADAKANKQGFRNTIYQVNGDEYRGEWKDNKRHANENRFEGQWVNDKKNGRGKYFFLGTGQLMEGIWINDVPKCCQMVDLGRERAPEPTQFGIPEIKLEDPNGVLRETQEQLAELLLK